jgi:cellulose synthase operon protein C
MRHTILLALCAGLLATVRPAHAQVVDEVNTFRLAQTYEQAGNVENALRFYNDLYTFRPANTAYFDGVRRCLTALKRYDEVIALITKRIDGGQREPSLFVQRGSTWYRKGDEAKARDDWDAAIAMAPRNPQIYMAIADEAVDNRLYRLATEILLKGREATGTPTMFVFELARAYTMDMRFDEAMDEYLRYLIAEPGAQWQVQQHIMQFAEIPQALESALRVTVRTAARNENNLAVQQLLAWLYMERKDYVGAAGVYRTIDKLRKSNGQELAMFAQRAYTDNQFLVARDVYRDLFEKYPESNLAPECEFHIARCTEALAEQALVPAALEPVKNRNENTFDRALALYRAVAQKYGQHPVGFESRYRIGWILFTQQRDAAAALAMLREVAPLRRSAQGRLDADILIGDVLLAQGNIDEALAQYQQILARPGANGRERGEIAFKIAEIHYFQGAFETALTELEPLGENSAADIANDALALTSFITRYSAPTDVPLRAFAAAQLLVRRNRFDEAIGALRSLLGTYDAMPVAEQAYITLGATLRDADRPTEAVAVWEEFLTKMPESADRDVAMFGLGSLYETLPGQRTKAIDMYQRLLGELPASLYAARARERILHLRKSSS